MSQLAPNNRGAEQIVLGASGGAAREGPPQNVAATDQRAEPRSVPILVELPRPRPAEDAELLACSDERDLFLELRKAAWSEGWLAGNQIGYDAGCRDTLAQEAAQRREAAGLIAAATAGPAHDELERRRWMLRGEHRTRASFGRPHPDDFPGGDAA